MSKELTPAQQARYAKLRATVNRTYRAHQAAVTVVQRNAAALHWVRANAALDAFVGKYM